jgi:putative RecB family exonuclease
MHFSYTQLDTFLTCKLKYKFKYIQKIRIDVPTSIELFLGDLIHKVLRELYAVVLKNQRDEFQSNPLAIPTKDEVVESFSQKWNSTFSDSLLIPKGTPEFFFKRGVTMLQTYYDAFFPFTQQTILGLETSNSYQLPLGDTYAIRIDKFTLQEQQSAKDERQLCKDSANSSIIQHQTSVADTQHTDTHRIYSVIDYKTSSTVPATIDEQLLKQLAMYALWVKSTYGQQTRVVLTWVYVEQAKVLSYELTDEQLQAIYARVLKVIEDIKSEKAFLPTVSKLCNWCIYKSVCPAWSGQLSLKQF